MKPKILPPIYLLVTLVLSALLHRFVPIFQLLSPPLSYFGALFVMVGVGIAAVSVNAFMRAGTPIIPFEKSTTVVTTGFYRYTRNPMYLGMLSALLGVAMLLGSIGSFIPIPVFVLIIHNLFIRREEVFLETLFGEQYLDYKNTVRRWF